MKPEAIVRELYEAFNERDFERAAAAFAESCEYESIATGSVMRTGVEVVEGLRAWATAFPDGFVEMTNVIATGPWVVVEWHAQGHAGRPAARRAADRPQIRAPRLRDRRCRRREDVRYRDYFDRAQMYEPLGLMHLLTG